MTRAMTEARLATLVAAYGADPQNFPEAERAAARTLWPGAGHVAEEIAAAQALDAMLAGVQPLSPSAKLTAALIASAPAARQSGQRPRFLLDWPAWAPASAAASLVCGLIMGLAVAPATAASQDEVNSGFDIAFGDVILDVPAETSE